MNHDQPDGFVVVPMESDGTPRGNALWCADEAEVAATLEAWAPAAGLIMYRSTGRGSEDEG